VLGHDLRNPLNAISMSAEVLRRSATDPSVTSAMAERIHASVRRMAKMIDQLLDVARIRAGAMSLEMQSGDVLTVGSSIRDELESALAAGRIALTSSGDTRATFDADRLSQVFSNLVGNALQHGDPAAPVLVNISGEDAAAIHVRIVNRGAIPAERLPSLFEPFQAGGNSQKGGLGLGLYIASQFVQAHGGTVKVSAVDAGEIAFEFFIPRSPPEGSVQIKLEL